MARQCTCSASALALAVALVVGVLMSIPVEVQSIGVCNGMLGDSQSLPSRADVVQFYKSQRIGAMRIYAPDPETLQALGDTGIDLIMDVGNGNLSALASDPGLAKSWVQENVLAYPRVSIKYIAAGNEVVGGDTQNIVPAITNLNRALTAAGINSVKVSTAVKMDVLSSSSPPSTGVFKDAYMTEVTQLLKANGAPLLANVYPNIAKRDTPAIDPVAAPGNEGWGIPRKTPSAACIDLSYALFQQSAKPVNDNGNGLTYTNLFDAMVDAMYTALEKAGASDVPIVVSESGWPSKGDDLATVANAQTYNQNLIDHVGNGTPKRPVPLETYIFAMFNENQKDGPDTERNFGLFKGPDKTPVYTIRFTN